MSLINPLPSHSSFCVTLLSKYSTVEEGLSILDYIEPDPLTEEDQCYLVERVAWLSSCTCPVSTNNWLSECFDILLIIYIIREYPDLRIIRVIEQYMRRYEIDKRLQHTYEFTKFSPINTQEIDNEGYVIFSGVLMISYLITHDLRFINTLLKLKHSSLIARNNAQKIVMSL